jgi:L-asparaginase
MSLISSLHRPPTLCLALGGTIAGLSQGEPGQSPYDAAQLSIHHLLESVPMMDRAVKEGRLQIEQLAQIDSKDLSGPIWQSLLIRVAKALMDKKNDKDDKPGDILITHGSDTLEETAALLALVFQETLRETQRRVVLTGSIYPADHPQADGPANLELAFQTTQKASVPPGVWIAWAGQVLPAWGTYKNKPYSLDAFAHRPVDEKEIQSLIAGWTAQQTQAWLAHQQAKPHWAWPWVEIVTSTSLAHWALIPTLQKAGVAGLVVAATGQDSIHTAWMDPLEQAQKAGIVVLVSSRCLGQAMRVSTFPHLTSIDHLPRTSLPPSQARVVTLLGLMQIKPDL